MKKEAEEPEDDDLREEYDFASMAGGERGKYVGNYKTGTTLVALDPDVAAVFQTDEAVNRALRSLIEIAKAQAGVNL